MGTVTLPNKLIGERSPYLLQHAHNPVDWHPWGKEAFDKARKEDKPIFLSIGYFTCHWCHVIERESFMDPVVAGLMNKTFVSILVDREERPDIDLFFMKAAQYLCGSAGWPLNIIMTPDKKPFFAGTYIPKESMYNKIGMMHLIPQIRQIWRENKKNVIISSNEVASLLQDKHPHDENLSEETIHKAFNELEQDYDREYGGFGYAPKFPMASNILFLMRYWKKTANPKALSMAENTLTSLRKGGIYDQIGLGFHRYTIDNKWRVAHFEKTLYDQALLAIAYLEAYQITKNSAYKRTAEEIFDFVRTELTSPEGGFYSGIDADSEGEEGKYYLWTDREIKEVLSETEYESFHSNYGTVTLFEEEGRHDEKSVIYNKGSSMKEGIRLKLLKQRIERTPPNKDTKTLTDWNSLMIAAFAMGGRVFSNKNYIDLAEKGLEYIYRKLYSEELMHIDGISAYLADYSYLIWASLEMYEATFNAKYLKEAKDLNMTMIEKFWDKDNNGFFYSEQSELPRQKEIFDGAVPSASSIALLDIIRLAKITGDTFLGDLAGKIIRASAKTIKRNPSYFTMFLSGYLYYNNPSVEIVVMGDKDSADTTSIINALNKEFIPNMTVILNPDTEVFSDHIREKPKLGDKTIVYVCRDYTCKEPATDVNKLMEQLQ